MKYTTNSNYFHQQDHSINYHDQILTKARQLSDKKYQSIGYNADDPIYRNIIHERYFNDQKVNKINKDYQYWSRNQQQTLFPLTNVGAVKKQQQKQYQQPFMHDNQKFHNDNYPNSYTNRLNTYYHYPYTYTEYELLKGKMEEKRKAEERWLESQISRLKRQDMLEKEKLSKSYTEASGLPLKLEKKKMVKQILVRTKESSKITKDQKRFISSTLQQPLRFYDFQKQQKQTYLLANDQIRQKNNSSKILSSQIQDQNQYKMSQKKYDLAKEKHNQKLFNAYSFNRNHNLTNSGHLFQNQQRIKTEKYRDADGLYFSQRNLNSQSIGKDRDSIQDKIITQNMISNAFIFDHLKQTNSDFEEEQESNSHKEKIDNQQPFLKKQSQQHNNNKNQKSLNSPGQTNNLNDIKRQKRYTQLLNTIQRKALKQKSRRNKSYSKYLVFNSSSDHSKQQNSSIDSEVNLKKSSYKKLLLNIANQQQDQMQIYKSNEQAEQANNFPHFSPYRQHKHLPGHNPYENYLVASLDRKKPSKLYRALEQKKQAEVKNHINLKSLIVDEIEKKKILMKQSELKTNPTVNASHINETYIKSQVQQVNKIEPRIFYHPQQGHVQLNQGHQAITNGLKIQLQILKQQLQQKNRKVVDLEVELMKIKNGIAQTKKSQVIMKTVQIDVEIMTEQPPQIIAKRIQSKQVSSQTTPYFKSIKLSKQNINQKVLPNPKIQSKQSDQLAKARKHIHRLQQKLMVQQQAMTNFLQDISMYQQIKQDLQKKIKLLQQERQLNPSRQQ